MSQDVRDAILAECEKARQGHDWWCESIRFATFRPKDDGRLMGWIKLSLGGYTARDGSYITIDEEDADDLMARRDVTVILRWLCFWSVRFGVSWSLELAGVDMGLVENGKVTEKVVHEFRDQTGWDIRAPIDEARARELSKKYASRNE